MCVLSCTELCSFNIYVYLFDVFVFSFILGMDISWEGIVAITLMFECKLLLLLLLSRWRLNEIKLRGAQCSETYTVKATGKDVRNADEYEWVLVK